MDLGLKSSLMVIFIRVNIKKGSFMGRANMFGQMDHPMKDPSMKEVGMEKEVGSHLEVEVMCIMEGIKTIKKVDMVDTYGRMAVFMKETLKTI